MLKGKVLITCGTGFLGVHLARKFLKGGFVIALFDTDDLTSHTFFVTI